MLFSRKCVIERCGLTIGGIVCPLMILAVQASPVSAEDPPARSPVQTVEIEQTAMERLEFEQIEFDHVREGYVGLRWNTIADADRYQVTEAAGDVMYRGEFPRAFISGLPNGTYSYDVSATNSAGKLIVRSSRPAVVHVVHWPMSQAIASFVIGLIVFLTLITVIIRGSLAAERTG